MFCICVLSAHLGNFKHIDSQTPDTAGCHVWRACAWRLTAQGYLKGCANFALFTAPINSVCFGGSLCEVWMLDAAIDGQHVALRCLCFCVVHFNRLRWCALSPVTFCLTPAWLPRKQPCHSSQPWRPGRGKCRRQQSAGRSRLWKVAVLYPPHFLVFLISLTSLSFVASLSPSPCLPLLTPCSFHPFAFSFDHTYKLRHGFNTIPYSTHLNLRHSFLQ